MDIPNLLRQIADHLESAEPEKVREFWPSQIPGQQIPVVTGDISKDFVVAMMGGVPKPTPERDANLAEWERQHNAGMFAGRYAAASLSDVDAAFIYAAAHREPGTALSNHIYWSAWLLSGSRNEINSLIQRGENAIAGRTYQQVIDQYPDTELKRDFMGAR